MSFEVPTTPGSLKWDELEKRKEAQESFDSTIESSKSEEEVADALVFLFETSDYDYNSVPADKLAKIVEQVKAIGGSLRNIARLIRQKYDDLLVTPVPWLHDEKYRNIENEQEAFSKMESDREQAYRLRDRYADVFT